jgi:hypothetical protein
VRRLIKSTTGEKLSERFEKHPKAEIYREHETEGGKGGGAVYNCGLETNAFRDVIACPRDFRTA